ncbi:hypothetical protein ACH5RR_020686 [Cinchona calisaya]|uniref:AT-rich interactive domain-containing protein 1-like n=1 Tax=Cinchona calisaya TaxID=153742 RepID=A0ABD2ZF55_9GENT
MPPKSHESERIKFIEQRIAAVPCFLAENGNPLEIPSVANDSEYNAIPKKNPFQAYLPCLSTTEDYVNDPNNLKWNGMKTWPRTDSIASQETDNSSNQAEGGSETNNNEVIGKGRSLDGACDCKKPGSVDCIYGHMKEERRKLKAELGPAFETWKFKEMGGIKTYADSWTLGEMLSFFKVMKKRNLPSSMDKTFLELAKKSLPNKSSADIVSYYYNFYLPSWRSRKQTKSRRSGAETIADIDTDDDGPAVLDEKKQLPPSENRKGLGKEKSIRAAASGVSITSNAKAVDNKYLGGLR